MDILITTASFWSGLSSWDALFALLILGTAFSDFWENELLDHLFRARAYTAPTVLAVALYTAAPGETGGGTEVSGGSYARVDHPPLFSNWEGTGAEVTAVDSAGRAGIPRTTGSLRSRRRPPTGASAHTRRFSMRRLAGIF